MVKKYKYNCDDKLSAHFSVQDFRCKCGKHHDILIDTKLVDLLEDLYSKLEVDKLKVYSGYRCSYWDKHVGGSGSGSHTEGKAADFYCLKNAKRISSGVVCVTLENMKDYKGIGFRCGGQPDSTGDTHADVRNRQWYGNEASKTPRKAVTKDWYKYFSDVRIKTRTKMNIRSGAGTNYKIVGTLKKDSVFRATELKWKNKDGWLKMEKGYICLCQDKKYYCDIEKVTP